MLIGEAINTNLIDFGLTRSGLEHTIYRTWGEHANRYTTDEHTIYRTWGKHANRYTTDAVTRLRSSRILSISFDNAWFYMQGIRLLLLSHRGTSGCTRESTHKTGMYTKQKLYSSFLLETVEPLGLGKFIFFDNSM